MRRDSRRPDPRSRPARRPRRGRSCAAPQARARRGNPRKPWNGSLSAAGAGPGLGAGGGRAGRAIPCLPPAPASRCSTRYLRRDPPCRRGAALRAWRCRAPPPPPDSPPQRRRRRAARPPLRHRRRRPCRRAPSALAGPRRPAARPRPRPARRRCGRLDLAVDPNGLAASLKGSRRGGRSGFGGRQGRGRGVFRLPGRPSRRSRNPRPLGVRPRPRPPAALAPARAADRDENLDPGLRSHGRRAAAKARRPRLAKAAAGAIALAAASALDLAADLSRRAETLIAVAPKLRAEPAAKIVDLLLAEDCVSPAEAARQAPMTDRAARRLFDRLVRLAPRANSRAGRVSAVRPMTPRRAAAGGTVKRFSTSSFTIYLQPPAGANGC